MKGNANILIGVEKKQGNYFAPQKLDFPSIDDGIAWIMMWGLSTDIYRILALDIVKNIGQEIVRMYHNGSSWVVEANELIFNSETHRGKRAVSESLLTT